MPQRLPVAHRRPAWIQYGIALVLVGIAYAATLLLPWSANRPTIALFYAVVALTATFAGLGPSLLATAAGCYAVATWLMGPAGELPTWEGAVRLIAFASVSLLLAGLGEMRLRRERSERALRVWNEVTLSSIGDGVLVADARGRVLFLNAAAIRITGWSAQEAVGRSLGEVFRAISERTREPLADPGARVRSSGAAVRLGEDTLLVARDGREIPVDDSAAPIRSEDGEIVGLVIVFRDVSEQRIVEQRRQSLVEEQTRLLEREAAARAEAQAANRTKDEFLATLSHELRTPLNAIVGWTALLRSERLAPEQIEHGYDVIERNAQRQMRLIEDVLDVSRIVSGKLRLEREPLELARLVGDAVDAVRPAADANRIELRYRAPDTPTYVDGDGPRLTQIAANLLSNAVRFTPAGGRVEVSLRADGADAELVVADTGQGIAPDFLPHVFDRFRQEDGSISRRHGGLGLGLAIVRHLVELHGGSVHAASDGVGRGATFTVRLPLARDVALPARRERAAHAAPDLGGARVLLVDDDADALEVLGTALATAGAELRTAQSPEDALRIVSDWKPHLFVLDLAMPGLDGHALLRQLRAQGFAAPAIALSAHADAGSRLAAYDAGFQHFVAKPVTPAALRGVVAATLRSDRAST
ncbi:MAG: hybrid sensor histidine kinase/response regulator [Proteobacteria bacterium]|nr:MAG: hybrid sensor histidine kinase/response regulator [Pseudomonadota bacterium]